MAEFDRDKFLASSQKSAKEFLDDALENLTFCEEQVQWGLEQVKYWQERVAVSKTHLEECKAHYEDTLTWGTPTPAEEA